MTSPSQDVVFSRPFRSSHELENLRRVLDSDHVHGDGAFTRSASERLREITDSAAVFLTTSGTDALEMTARLLDIGPGDEVILPSFTFPSAANAVALTGASCVFVDLDPLTGNLEPVAVAEAVTSATRAISVMHYGGVPVDLPAIEAIADEHGIAIVEDNAHGLGVLTDRGVLGSIGRLGIQSFHDTKNVHSGEGGALLVNDPALIEKAEILREKGTDRSKFIRGQVDKYRWVGLGSSYLMSELNAAVLDSQLNEFPIIQAERFAIWNSYAERLSYWAADNGVRLMAPPAGIHAAHVFWMIMPSAASQEKTLRGLRSIGIEATSHYVPLDTSPAGRRYGRTLHPLERTADFSSRLVRLPLWAGMSENQVSRVVEGVEALRPVVSAVG
ncbi:MAG: dTDP-4-amino-4,6-dideoxygalactose transaminase [Actinomycetota bacterium]|nr:dTDP-4-amino-4,6-dideoxygalactose transaminase [Actinomycetota bacterium]